MLTEVSAQIIDVQESLVGPAAPTSGTYTPTIAIDENGIVDNVGVHTYTITDKVITVSGTATLSPEQDASSFQIYVSLPGNSKAVVSSQTSPIGGCAGAGFQVNGNPIACAVQFWVDNVSELPTLVFRAFDDENFNGNSGSVSYTFQTQIL